MGYNGGMVEERDVKTIPCEAGESLSCYRIVTFGAANNEVVAADSGASYPLGVTGNASEVNDTSYADGDQMAVKYDGIVYINMYSTGSQGDAVMAYTNGQGTQRGVTSDVWVIGVAMQDWTNGQTIPVMIDRLHVGDYTETLV